jgi:histidinol-phosphate aminotransferase
MNPFDELPLRDDLRGRTPYGAPQLDVPVRLNTNENPYPVPDEVAEAIEKAVRATLRDLNRYPDREAVALREDLAQYVGHGVTVDNIWAANGSNEIQQQLLQAFGGKGRDAMGFVPSYSMHSLQCVTTGTGWIDGQRSSAFELTPASARAQVRVYQPDIVFICSPNNPTGTAAGLDVIEAVASEAPGMVIVDEAYYEFGREGTESAVTLLPRFPKLVVTRTMSKAFAFAGGRVGYLVGGRPVVETMQLVRLPYHLSALTQAAARAALAHAPALLAQVEAIKGQRDRIVSALRELGFTVADSDANFVLFGGFRDQQRVWQALLDRGVLVRDVGLPGWLRVSAGTPAETEQFLNAMAQVSADA